MTSSFVALALGALVGVLPPHNPNQRVHDFANELSPEVRQALEMLCRKVEANTTAQVAVVTVPNLEGKSVDEYANQLFNTWGIGRADVNNGVLLLHAPNERQVRIEVGRGLEPLLTDGLAGDLIDERVLPLFRRDDFAGGLRAGTEAIVELLEKYPEAARGVPGSAPKWIRTKRTDALTAAGATGAFSLPLILAGYLARKRRGYSTVWYYLLLAGALAVVAALVMFYFQAPKSKQVNWSSGGAAAALGGAALFSAGRYRRYKPRSCAKCGSRLVLLDEQADDEKLTELQRLEEKIGAVDYDVWDCPACLQTEVIRHVENSAIIECPKCHANTLKLLRTDVVTPATHYTSGLSREFRQCAACTAEITKDIVLPIISSSSSGGSSSGGGGGGSFGGGSSGGGGASRSY
jgi:uncharacterized protein